MINKKGSAQDFVVIIIWVMVVLVSLFIAYIFGSAVMDNASFKEIMGHDETGTDIAASVEAQNSWSKIGGSGLDNMFVGIFFVLHIAEIILAATVPIAGPMFLGFNLLMVLIIGVFASQMQNVLLNIFQGFALTNFPSTFWVLNHFFMIEIGFMIMLMFVLYKTRTGLE
jgi:hypothetical protein